MKTSSMRIEKIRWVASLLLLSSFLILDSCKSSDTTIAGNWSYYGSYSGSARSGAFQFTIDDKTYVGLGFGGLNNNQYLTDAWVYDLKTTHWDTIRHFPGTGREGAFSFSLGGKGYVGTGYNHNIDDLNLQFLKDFWEYDPATDQWTQLKDFPGGIRYNSTAFISGENAFVGLGYNGNYFDDFYKYTPATDSWTKSGDFHDKRQGAMTMTISGIVYVFGGEGSGITVTDFWEFSPESETWIKRTKISTDPNFNDFALGVHKAYANAFALDVYGYVVLGSVNGTPSTVVYQYNPANDTWTKMTAFEGSGRYQAVSWVIGGRAFIGTGTNGTKKLDDVWEWQPTVAYDANN